MTTEEKRTIEMIRKLRESLETGELLMSEFPLEDFYNLLKATLGTVLLNKIKGLAKNNFQATVAGYQKMLEHCKAQGDTEGGVRVLLLLEEQYVCLDKISDAYQEPGTVNQYKAAIVNVGESFSALLYAQHQNRQKKDMVTGYSMDGGRGVVYTCTFAPGREIYQPEYINVNWDYVCFTEVPERWGTKEGVWEYRRLDVEGLTTLKELFYYCMLMPHKALGEYDYSIWVFPGYKIVGDLELFYDIYGKGKSFLAFPSYIADDIYDTMLTTLSNDDANISLRKKRLQYEKEGYPRHYGLVSNTFMIRYHGDEELSKVMETWQGEMEQCECLREHGFIYAAWKQQFDYAICDLFVELNSYIKYMGLDLEIKGD